MLKLVKAVLVAGFVVGLLTACGGADERKVAHLQKARESIKAGNIEKARIELKNVLQIDPKYGEAYFELGKIFEEQKNFRKAYINYLKAAELSPDNLENQARLGKFYLILLRDEAKAQEKVDFILGKDPANINGLLLKAVILSKNGKKGEAMAILEDNYEKFPDNVDNTAFLAAMYIKDERIDDAIRVLQVTKGKTSEQKINLMLAKLFVFKKQYGEAENIFKEEIENNPDDAQAYMRLAALYNQMDDKARAEQVLRDAIKNKPDDSDRKLALVKFVKDGRGLEAAETVLQGLIDESPSDGALPLTLAMLYYQDSDVDKAKRVYESIKKDFPESEYGVKARGALATILIEEKKLSEASEELKSALEISPNDPAINLLLAKLALNEKRYEDAVLSLRIVVKQQPENVDAYILLAAAHEAAGEKDQANAVMNNAYENNRGNPDALLKVIKYFAARNNEEKTLQIAKDILAMDEDNYEALSIKAIRLNKDKSYKEAKELADILVEKYPGKSSGYLQSIPYFLSTNQVTEAISLLEKGAEESDNKGYILKLLTSLQIRTNQSDKAIDRLVKSYKESGDYEIGMLLAKTYIVMRDYDNAEAQLKKAIHDSPDVNQAYILLSDLYNQQDKAESAVSLLKAALDSTNHSEAIFLQLAKIYEQNKRFDEAIDLYTESLKYHSESIVTMNNLATLLVDHRADKVSLDQARQYVEKISSSKQPAIVDTVAWVNFKLGKSDKAIEILKKLLQSYPDIGVFNYHLGFIYKSAGNEEMAKVYLRKAVAAKDDFAEKSMANDLLKSMR